MATEIEYKYLVKDDSYKSAACCRLEIKQGYLSRNPHRVVRIRIVDDKGYITVKGKNECASRLEFEYEIPYVDALDMLGLCEPPVLEKTRYEVFYDGWKWEVDEFQGQNAGLVIAEIELPEADTPFALPPFVGKNVTGNPEYYNSNL